MNDLFEDKMTSKFREVLEHYEYKTSPDKAWENFEKKLYPERSWWKRWLKWYYFVIVGIVAGGLICLFLYSVPSKHETKSGGHSKVQTAELSSVTTACENKKSEFQSLSYKKLDEKIPELKPEKLTAKPATDRGETNNNRAEVSFNKLTPHRYNPSVQPETELSLPDLPDKPFYVAHATQKHKKLKIPQLDFRLPSFSLKNGNKDLYKNFVGPNQLHLSFISERSSVKNIGNLGWSKGFGIEFEGPVNSFISASLAVNILSINYSQDLDSITLLQPKYSRTENDLFNDGRSNIVGITDTATIQQVKNQYIEVPISIKLKLIETKNMNLRLTAGFSSIFFLKEDYITPFSNSEHLLFSERRSFTRFENIHPLASANVGLSFSRNITNRLEFETGLSYKFGLVKLGGNKFEVNRFSWSVGILYRFGREN